MMRILVYAIYLEVITLSKELILKSVNELAPLIENKSISPVELTKSVLDHAENTQRDINAYMDIYREDAEADAKKSRNRNYKRKLPRYVSWNSDGT